jgi:drug/metabolite transporter (DMT)-like permease
MSENKFQIKLLSEDFEQTKTNNDSSKYFYYDYLSFIINYFHPNKERTEREKLFISFIANFFFAISNLIMKLIATYYPLADASTTSLYRFLLMYCLSYLYMAMRKVEHIDIKNIKSKTILFIRVFGAYFIAVSVANSVYYLRLGTAITFFFISPFFTSIASIYFFNDKCRPHNAIGLIICMFSILMITNSEKESGKDNPNANLLIGSLWGTVSMINTVAVVISTKYLLNEVEPNNLNHYIGKYNTIIGSIICILTNNLFYLEPGYVLLSFFNGFTFWLALLFLNISLKINNIIAVSCISFLSLVYAFSFGVILFDEKLSFTDILACSMIFSFNLYTILFSSKEETKKPEKESKQLSEVCDFKK